MAIIDLNDDAPQTSGAFAGKGHPAVANRYGSFTTFDVTKAGDVGAAGARVVLHERIKKAFVAEEGREPNANDSDYWRLYSEIEKGGVTDETVLPTSGTGQASSRSGAGYSSSPFDTNRGAPQDVPVEGGPLTGEPMAKVAYGDVPVSALRKLAANGDQNAADELHRRGLPIGSAPNVDADELHKAADTSEDSLIKAIERNDPHYGWIKRHVEKESA